MSNDQTKIEIFVDGEHFRVSSMTMSGAQIKALVGKDIGHQLFIEGPGDRPDRQVSDDNSVELKSGMHFYTVPPAVFGS